MGDLYTQNAGLTHKAKFWCNYMGALSKLCRRLSQTSSTSSPSWSPRCSTGQSAPASSPRPPFCPTPTTASSPPDILTSQSTQRSTEPTGQTQSDSEVFHEKTK